MPSSLDAIIEAAWQAGRQLDLSGAVFGPALPRWEDQSFVDVTHTYYYFLAGFVRTQACSRILEIGTHYGGSGLAMLRGVPDADEAQVVSVDITDLNPALHTTPGFTKLTGNASSDPIFRDILGRFGGQAIDLIYIDTNHSLLPTATALGLYGMMLRPRFIILDDINLNDDMQMLWSHLCRVFPESADCSDLVPAIRRPHCGFGVIRLRT